MVLMASGPPAFDFEPATIGVADCVNDFVEFESEKTKQAWGQACDSSSSPSANLRFVPNGKPHSLNVTQGGEGGENVGISSSGSISGGVAGSEHVFLVTLSLHGWACTDPKKSPTYLDFGTNTETGCGYTGGLTISGG